MQMLPPTLEKDIEYHLCSYANYIFHEIFRYIMVCYVYF